MTAERFPVEAGHITMFARAVGDPNPVYHDDRYAASTECGGVIAPPTFVQASAHFDPEYPLRPKIGEIWFGSGAEPTGLPGVDPPGTGLLHAEQHYEYHRHLRPGDVLSATVRPGESWEKQSRRAGTLHFAERITEYRDQHGELVITARDVGVRTERPVEQ